GGNFTLDAILDHLHQVTGAPRPRLRLPPSVMLPIAAVSSWAMKRLFPAVPPRFTPGTIRLLGSGKHADASKARRELGLVPSSVMEAFTESVQWFRARGQLH